MEHVNGQDVAGDMQLGRFIHWIRDIMLTQNYHKKDLQSTIKSYLMMQRGE